MDNEKPSTKIKQKSKNNIKKNKWKKQKHKKPEEANPIESQTQKFRALVQMDRVSKPSGRGLLGQGVFWLQILNVI